MNDFTNLTRSNLKIVADDGHELFLPTSGHYAHVRKIVRSMYRVDGVPITDVAYEVDGIPDLSRRGENYVVSWKTLMTMKALGYEVDDIYAPDTFLRDGNNKVIGARSLSRIV